MFDCDARFGERIEKMVMCLPCFPILYLYGLVCHCSLKYLLADSISHLILYRVFFAYLYYLS